ncbi:hypothetical protein [Burkholderia gladioli]|uniref:hypothetical protein n=1 Tax=Burkholderia gladioli TaxID=28095 RepID=UPI00164163EB|nr:hypothetical protein [Burkholderia gladioli]
MMPSAPSSAAPSRIHLLPLTVSLWLVVVSFGLCMDHIALSHLTRNAGHSAQHADVVALQRSQSDIAQQLATLRRRPDTVSRADLVAATQATDQRLAALEQSVGTRAPTDALTALQTRLDQIEAERKTAPTKPLSRHMARASSPAVPKAVTPPFALRSVELRGGEWFVSITPTVNAPLDQVTLLRPGDTSNGWLLESIDGRTATFEVDGVSHPLIVPETTP